MRSGPLVRPWACPARRSRGLRSSALLGRSPLQTRSGVGFVAGLPGILPTRLKLGPNAGLTVTCRLHSRIR